MKFITILIALCLYSAMLFSQNYFNNLYNYENTKEFNRELLPLENGNYLAVGSTTIYKENGEFTTGMVIREISVEGEQLWDDFIYEPEEKLYLSFPYNHNAITIGNTTLVIMGTAQDFYTSEKKPIPFYLSYNIQQKEVLYFKTYEQNYGAIFFSTVLHTDGFIYSVGLIKDLENYYDVFDNKYGKRKLFCVKLDLQGNVIWESIKDYNDTSVLAEIESYDDGLLVVTGSEGELVDGFMKRYGFIATIDTGGAFQNFNRITERDNGLLEINKGSGTIGVEVLGKDVYYTSLSSVVLDSIQTQLLVKLNSNLEIVWQKLIPNTSTYGLSYRRMEILNNKIIIGANIRYAFEYTNRKVWSYATAFDLNGMFLWEHVYKYDPVFTHHIDDIESAPNGDLIFLGTVINRHNDTQDLWLFRTDSLGCGTVQDTCYYTLDQYFGLDTMVNIIEPQFSNFAAVEIQGNPFTNNVQLKAINHKPLQLKFFTTEGQLFATKNLNGQATFDTQSWPKGIYFIQVFDDGKLLGIEKLVKQ